LEIDSELYFSFYIVVQELSYWDKKLLWGIYYAPWKIDREVSFSLRRNVLGLEYWRQRDTLMHLLYPVESLMKY
jgi:hypothetical protein